MKFSTLNDAFWLKLWFSLKSEAAKNYLNYVWWLLEPALHVAVFYFVFGLIFQRGGEGFIAFLLCGQIPYLWFSRTVNNAAGSILGGRGLIQQMAIPTAFFPAVVVGKDALKQTVVFAVLLLFLATQGAQPSWMWLTLPAVVFTQLLLVTGGALLVAAVTPFVPDVRFLIQAGMMMLLFASGIFYDYSELLSEQQQSFFLMNPVANLIVSYRNVLLHGDWPNWPGLFWISMLSGACIMGMLIFYRRAAPVYARLVVE
ncbi:hypothetical protein CKO42_08905 [Lamprobacter modestohalophilus]|uniref:Transport permease protein n=1 Tax=Lamprobacter modestohalophilus TaxID=1064514 RepID=A0A9X1B404_9GAMM|nr:hypothetical protein [Lamprobacter modestohalophilus]